MRPDDRFCPDAFAWLTWLQDEPGAAAVATALEFQATLVAGDPEIEPLVGSYDLRMEWLPQSRASRMAESRETP